MDEITTKLLGVKAVDKRFISEKQLVECLNTIEFFETDKSLEQVFLDKGYLTQVQLDRLKDSLFKEIDGNSEVKEPPAPKKMFGSIALEQNMIDDNQLMDALDEQETYLDRGVRVQMGQILVKKGYITLAQLSRIVESQSRKLLYCPRCQFTKIVHNYDANKIYKNEECGCDVDLLIKKEQKGKKVTKKKTKSKGKSSDDIGDLQEIVL